MEEMGQEVNYLLKDLDMLKINKRQLRFISVFMNGCWKLISALGSRTQTNEKQVRNRRERIS